MKKFTRWAVAIGAALALLAAPLQGRAEDVTITDREMLSCINDALHQDPKATVTSAQLGTITALTCFGARDLSVLPTMPNLNTLEIFEGPSGAVTIPATLTKLQKLTIVGGHLTSITIPSTLTRLSSLALDDNQLTSLSLPSTLVNLRTLSVSSNRIADLGNLSWLSGRTFVLASDQVVPLPSTVTGVGYSVTSRGTDGVRTTVTPPAGVTWSNNKLTYSKAGTFSVTFEHRGPTFFGVFDGRFTQTVTAAPVLPAATGALGDHTGDKIADIYGVDPSGTLKFFKGSSTGRATLVSQVGTGWNQMSYLAQIKDLTGDNRSDFLVRRKDDNSLWLYQGVGGGAVAPVKQIGWNWGDMDQIVPAMNLAGGSTQYVVARQKSDGKLFRYQLTSGGFSGKTQIGNGWGVMRQFLSIGDFTGDGRSDVLGIRADDGTLVVYPGTASGTLGKGRQVGNGWGGFNRAFVPGDMTGDGRIDLVGERADGTVFLYPNLGTRWGTKREIMNGTAPYLLLA